MRVILALVVGVALGVGAFYFYNSSKGRSAVQKTGDQIESSTRAARDAIQDKLKAMDLRPEDIKTDLQKTGQVIRRKATQAGQAIADSTADARITTAIKGKLVANKDLSALSISVNTTAGVVTLSGSVGSAEDVSKAMLVAMETDGVREVVSTLQVRPK